MLRKLSNNIPSLTLCIRYTTVDKFYEAGQATVFTNFQLNNTILCRCGESSSLISVRFLNVTEVLPAVDHVRQRMDSI